MPPGFASQTSTLQIHSQKRPLSNVSTLKCVHLQVTEVPLSVSSLVSNASFVLGTGGSATGYGGVMIVWHGSAANLREKMKSQEVANEMRADKAAMRVRARQRLHYRVHVLQCMQYMYAVHGMHFSMCMYYLCITYERRADKAAMGAAIHKSLSACTYGYISMCVLQICGVKTQVARGGDGPDAHE